MKLFLRSIKNWRFFLLQKFKKHQNFYNVTHCIVYIYGYSLRCLLVFFPAELSPCIPNPCQHDGSCTIAPSNLTYTCDCKPGFTSENCDDGEYSAKELAINILRFSWIRLQISLPEWMSRVIMAILWQSLHVARMKKSLLKCKVNQQFLFHCR